MSKTHVGRKKGGHNRGFFYRKGRGWYVAKGSQLIPLRYEDGQHIKNANCDEQDVIEAHARFVLDRTPTPEDNTLTVLSVCQTYLADAKQNGAPKTHTDRADTLFDFCFGLPPEFRQKGNAAPRRLTAEEKREIGKKRIHKGYGQKAITKLLPLDVTEWLNSHKSWSPSGRRTRIQAVKRAFNFAVEQGMVARNPIRGFKVPRSKGRITHITPEQEQAIYKNASPALAQAVRVCIRTGARFGSEFCPLTAKHVVDMGERMEWVFEPIEVKTRKKRVIRISDPAIIQIVRQQMNLHRTGPIFRNAKGEPWHWRNLSQRFRVMKHRLERKGIDLDEACCMYSCRHTYAKRTLQGHWTGRPTNIETLAKLMGNSPQVCRDHYLQWSDIDNEHLWDAS
jgi:integrase